MCYNLFPHAESTFPRKKFNKLTINKLVILGMKFEPNTKTLKINTLQNR